MGSTIYINSPEEILIKGKPLSNNLNINSLADLVFNKLSHRSENCEIFNSHFGSKYIAVSLEELRNILYKLLNRIALHNIDKGDTVALIRINGCSELNTAILFLALAIKGVRVLMPMYIDMKAIPQWLSLLNCTSLVLPRTEIENLASHVTEITQLEKLADLGKTLGIPILDTEADLNMTSLLKNKGTKVQRKEHYAYCDQSKIGQLADEVLVINTSGSSGAPDLVTYRQEAFLKSCQSWDEAGLFDNNLLGGKGFTPLFTHTMGIRQLFNALWTGQPQCLINASMFLEKPETVAFLLQRMQPNHVIGGPSVFRLLLEIMRNFPKLKINLRKSFKYFISSGSTYSIKTKELLKSAFNVPLHNAFGTTETQQVLNTLINPNINYNLESNSTTLGTPLPGVSIKLIPLENQRDLFKLFVKAPFMHHRIIQGMNQINSKDKQGFYYTGDIVRYKNEQIFYIGRENTDFLNDGFGVKVPLPLVRKYYNQIFEKAEQAVFIPFEEDPGLALMLFVNLEKESSGIIRDPSILKEYSNIISKINHDLKTHLSPFEYQHFTIRQVSIINSEPPLTEKGTISHYELHHKYKRLVQLLQHYNIEHPTLVQVDKHVGANHAFTSYLSPYLGQMLKATGMDYIFHRGKKDSLFTYKGQKEIEILDLVGGYGTGLLGHNHPKIIEEIKSFFADESVALSDQMSIQQYPGLLAKKLHKIVSKLTGKSYRTYLASTGSEAIELAIHHAHYEMSKRFNKLCSLQYQTNRGEENDRFYTTWEENKKIFKACKPTIIAIKHSFHGCTVSARSILFERKRKDEFTNILPLDAVFIDDTDPDWKEQIDEAISKCGITITKLVRNQGSWKLKRVFFSTIICAIAEPIQGEGGIREVNQKVLKYLNNFDFPLVLDEIQSGLGRSGSIITFPNIPADYYLFGKALGGNAAKIAAVLIAENRYQEDFQPKFVSTFSNGGLAAKIALRTLDLIESDKIPERAQRSGNLLLQELESLKNKYPNVISNVGGRGLMIGIKFKDFKDGNQFLLRALCETDKSGYIYSTYLLKQHALRILPSLSAPDTLRIEPSAYISNSEIQKTIVGIEDLCKILEKDQLYELLKPLMEEDRFDDYSDSSSKTELIESCNETPAPGAIQVGFIVHFVYVADELRGLAPDLQKASNTGLHILFNKFQQVLECEPVKIFAKNLFNNRIHFTFYSIPLDTASMERLYLDGKRQKILEKIQQTVNLAASEGCEVISLGGFNSILTNNTLSLVSPIGTKVISGNTLTVASGIRHIIQRIQTNFGSETKLNLAVVGATGNIGSAIAEYFVVESRYFQRIMLFGRKQNKLEKTLMQLKAKQQKSNLIIIESSIDLNACKNADVIIIATNSNVPLLYPHHINRKNNILIADVSVPSAVSEEVKSMPNTEVLPFSAYVNLPYDPELKMSSHTPKGAAFCCAAEAMLCGLRPNDLELKGPIQFKEVNTILQMAEEIGFYNSLGPIKSFITKEVL